MGEVIYVDFENQARIQPEADSDTQGPEIPFMVRAAAKAIASRSANSKLAKEAFSWLSDDEIALAIKLAKDESPEAS